MTTLNEPIRIALTQPNTTVGAVDNNAVLLFNEFKLAAQRGADIVLTSELALSGYPPEDLLLRPNFTAQCNAAFLHLQSLTLQYPGTYWVLGHPSWKDQCCYNAASVIKNGVCLGTYYKHELPNYGVFDEVRYFSKGTKTLTLDVKGTRFGIAICEDVWFKTIAQRYQQANVKALLVLNASPYHRDKLTQRMDVIRSTVCSQAMSYIGVNGVGGQDELVFDGAGFVLDPTGQCTTCLPQFDSTTHIISVVNGLPQTSTVAEHMAPLAQIYQALVLATRDYVQKNGFKGALLGLSGGVDSALVLAIACDALGAQAVKAVMMPTRYTADMSLHDSREMVARLEVDYQELPIEGLFGLYLDTLAKQFEGTAPGVAEENLQARIRGTLLMALSNKFGSIVLTTGNKSETAVGYCTLYGDMAGGFAVLKDVPKTMVYQLCAWRNTQALKQNQTALIPANILTRAPSAELRENQTDQDSLPIYEVLDAIVDAHLEHNLSLKEIVALGFNQDDVRRVLRLIQINEYKRRQSAVGPRITTRAFGRDWRMPITNGYTLEGL